MKIRNLYTFVSNLLVSYKFIALNPNVLYFHDETFFRCTELKKGFVDFENHFLRMLTHLEAFRHLRNLFEGFGKITFLFFSVPKKQK